jgi:predicted DNA-binding transcriptional regulator AlpA
MRTPAAARYLAISKSNLRKMRADKVGPPFVQIGPRAVAYRMIDLDEWLAARVRRFASDDAIAA